MKAAIMTDAFCQMQVLYDSEEKKNYDGTATHPTHPYTHPSCSCSGLKEALQAYSAASAGAVCGDRGHHLSSAEDTVQAKV
jgi:hypothetical protein